MQVFIFGAGASKASQIEVSPDHIPPLANDLFSEDYLPHAKRLLISEEQLREYREEAGKSISLESWLAEQWNDIVPYPRSNEFREKASKFGRLTFYLWLVLRGVSAAYSASNKYRTLLLKLKGNRFGLINFNYDTLLDQALYDVFSVFYHTPEAYYNHSSEIVYLKPHGSVNWLLPRRSKDPAYTAQAPYTETSPDWKYIYAAANMFTGDPLEAQAPYVLTPTRELENEIKLRFMSDYWYPLILLPLTDKLYEHFLGLFDKQIAEGKKLIASADEIYLIGYQAMDDIIRKMFADVSADTILHVVGMENAPEIMAKVLGWARVKEGKTFKEGFEAFVEEYQ